MQPAPGWVGEVGSRAGRGRGRGFGENESRKRFIERATIDRAIEAALEIQWKLMIAPARDGGLRCPGEILALRWDDVDWGRGRLTVAAPKTK